MPSVATAIKSLEPSTAAALIAAVGAATIGGFLFFQFGMGLPPCPLCLEQRYAFYFGVPLAILLWVGSSYGAKRKVLMAGFLVLAGMMIWNAGLGGYHAGVEWKFWPGPTDCSGPLNDLRGPGGLMNQLQSISVVRCDQAAWRLFGISMPGWNVLVSGLLATLAGLGARAAYSQPADEL